MFPYPFSFLTTSETGLDQVANNFSMDFDGVNDYMYLGTSSNLQPATSLSVSAWVTFDLISPWGGQGGILENQRTTGGSFGFKIYKWNDTINFMIMGTKVTYNMLTGGTIPAMVVGQWYHICGTWDGSTMELFIDTTSVGTGSESSTINYASAHAMIGKNQPYAGTWAGKIDEVALFDYELTSPDIQDIYDATDTNLTADLSSMSTPPIAWYRMGD